MDRKFKKLLLKSQLLSIEEQEFRELDQKYLEEFARDFHEERSLLAGQEPPAEKEEDRAFKIPTRVLKKLHRKLAMNTHPDVSKDSGPFLEMQAAYELGDAGKLFAMANDMSIEVKLTEKEMISMADQLTEKEQRLSRLKNRVRWVWCTSDKSDSLRAQIRRSIGITDAVWINHKKGKSS